MKEKTQVVTIRFNKKDLKRIEELKIFFKEKTKTKVIRKLIHKKIRI